MDPLYGHALFLTQNQAVVLCNFPLAHQSRDEEATYTPRRVKIQKPRGSFPRKGGRDDISACDGTEGNVECLSLIRKNSLKAAFS